ncbi:MAG: ABC transporter substrate-binding protein, partial [Clostridia bacterium]|nr:ABC transporter substrate-binding protein [Clostridia bacterium]
RTDAARAIVLDACANAYLEELSDDYERRLHPDLSYRFCPGYGGSSVNDLKEIFRILKPEKIGLSLTESNYMLPCKSMAGVIAVGNSAQKTCKDCAVFEHCEYRKEGGTCYGSENR